MRAYRKKHKERIRAQIKKHRRENRERYRAVYQTWYCQNKARVLAQQNGCAEEDVARVLKQDSCWLCGDTFRLAVDHCHKTTKVRDRLCAHCNMGLGAFKDRPDLLRKAADYLERHTASGLQMDTPMHTSKREAA